MINHRPGAQHKAADALSRLRTDGHDTEDIDDTLPVLAASTQLDMEAEGPSPDDTWLIRQVYHSQIYRPYQVFPQSYY